MTNMKREKIINRLFFVMSSLITILIPYSIFRIFINKNSILNFYPFNFFGDEIEYYRSSQAFAYYPNVYGYFSVSFNGDVASKYGSYTAHGPQYNIFYGLIERIFGMRGGYSYLLINIACLTIAVAFVVFFSNRKPKTILMIAVALVSYFPMLLFLVSGMVETLQISLAIIYASLLYKYLISKDRKFLIIGILYSVLMCFFRINYVVLLFPFLFYNSRTKFRQKAVYLILSIFLTVLYLKIISLFSAPYPNFLSEIMSKISIGDLTFLKDIYNHFIGELRAFFLIGQTSSITEWIFRIIYFSISILILIAFIKTKQIQYRVSVFILWSSFFILTCIYEVQLFKAVRTLSPLLFIVILLLILYENRISYIFITIMLVVTVCTSHFYKDYIVNASYSFSENEVYDSEVVESYIDCMPCDYSGDRWNNTVAINISKYYDYNVTFGLPEYLGLNILINNNFTDVTKCKYILCDEESEQTVNTEVYHRIKDGKMGILYSK